MSIRRCSGAAEGAAAVRGAARGAGPLERLGAGAAARNGLDRRRLQSWYFDRNGRNTIMWPGFTFEYRRRTKHFDAAAYRLAPRAAATS